jgi:hypothetical protein
MAQMKGRVAHDLRRCRSRAIARSCHLVVAASSARGIATVIVNARRQLIT